MSDKSIHTNDKIIPLVYFILDSFLKTELFSTGPCVQTTHVLRSLLPGMELAFSLPFTVNLSLFSFIGFPGGAELKTLPANAGGAKDAGSIPGWGRFPWSKKWQPTPVFLPGKSHGQRSLAGAGSWGHSQTQLSNWAQNSTSNIFYPHYYLSMYFIDFFITHLYWLVWHSLLNENLASILLQQYLHNIILTSYGNFSKCDMPAAAAAAKSLQSCPTLCDPIDGSPPGSAIPGILQARTLEWAAISFSNAWKWKVKVKGESEIAQLCPILSDPMDCSFPGSFIHGIFQARVLEWGPIAFSGYACYLHPNCLH